MNNGIELHGAHVRLEPLSKHHIAALVEASSGDPSFYTWSAVPQGEEQVRAYVEQALSLAASGRAVPFATVRQRDGVVIGTHVFSSRTMALAAGAPRAERRGLRYM